MKDILITAERQKKEIIIFSICFLTAFIINIISIIVYDTQWKELWTHIGYVFTISIFLYVLLAIVRGIIKLILKSFKKKKE